MRDRLIIRPALPGERAALEALQLRASLIWEEHRADLAAHRGAIALMPGAIEQLRVRVALLVGEQAPAGFSQWSAISHDAWELEGLFVEPPPMRNRIGGELVADVLGLARDAGASRVSAGAAPRAVAFYERCGFVREGDAATRFGRVVWMGIDLRG
ncbi:MAG TPA: GNAT family N-acetyltransferase [Solirubrobacteraceae bacterium]